jgi:putative NADH-flavin reductase
MKVLVFGAAGKTGSLVVEKAYSAGHEVSVFVHGEPGTLPAGVQVFKGDAGDAAAVQAAVAGQDAVIDTIGGKTPYKITNLESKAAANVIAAMQAEKVRRLIVISMMGVGDSEAQTPFWYEYLMQPTFLRGANKDKTAMESEVKASGLEFVIARPPILSDGPATGAVKIITADETGHKITRTDLAHWMVEQLSSDVYLGRAVVVANS